MPPCNDGPGLPLNEPELSKKIHPGSKEQNRLRGIWNDRIRLISQCATASESISSFTAEVKLSTALLNNATFRATTLINSGKNDGTNDSDDTAHTANQTSSRLTREQNALVARLEAEKAQYLNLRARLVEGDIVEKGEEGEFLKENEVEEWPQHQEHEENGHEKPGAKDLKGTHRGQQEQHDFDHLQSCITIAHLGDKIAIMKSVLDEIRQIASSRPAQGRVRNASTSRACSNTRKRSLDLVADTREESSFVSPSSIRAAPSSRHDTPVYKQDALALRVELEGCVHQVAELNLDVDSTDISNGLLEVALDMVYAEHAKSLQKREEAEAAERAEAHTEVTGELAQLAQQTIDLDMQVGEVTGTLTGLVLHVDDLEEMVEEERRHKDEAQERAAQMTAKLKSYAALQAENAAAISALSATFDAYPQQCVPLSPELTPTMAPRPSTAASSPTFIHPVYPVAEDLAASFVPTMTDAARPLLEHTSVKVASMVQQTKTTMIQALDVWMEKTLDAAEELALNTLSDPSRPLPTIPARPQGHARPFFFNRNNDCDGNDAHETILRMATPTASMSTPARSPPILSKISPLSTCPPLVLPGSDLPPSPSPAPVLRAQSVESLRYTPPPEEIVTISCSNNPRTPSSPPLSPLTWEASLGPDSPLTDLDSPFCMDNPLPEADTPAALDQPLLVASTDPEERAESPESSILSPRPDCLFLTDPSLRGIPVRLQPKDVRSRVGRPYAFVRIIPTASSAATVEVRDCRRGRHSGNVHRFPLDAVCYVPPTAIHQTAVCVAPSAGVDPAQKYYILKANVGVDGQCVVRKDPKPKGPNKKVDMLVFPARLLAQVAPTMFASPVPAPVPAAPDPVPVASQANGAPSAPAVVATEGRKKLTIKPPVPVSPTAKPNTRFDHPPPMWLKDPVFTGYRVQLKEQGGDDSTLELISVNTSTLTVEVHPFLRPAHRRRMLLKDVRHVVASAPYQMVVAIAGELKGTIMKVGVYDKDECTLYAMLQRHSHRVVHCERTYKTAHLAVVFPPRK